MIHSSDFLNLEKLIQKNEIQTYHSKTIAQRYSIKKGWLKKDVVFIKRDLDNQWIIAKEKKDCLVVPLWHETGSVKLKRIENV